MTNQTPTMGRIVLYQVTEADAAHINSGEVGRKFNRVRPDDVFPAIVVRVFEGEICNLQVFLDGDCSFWATSRPHGDGSGHWVWPPRV